jgi:RNA exonuclease 1
VTTKLKDVQKLLRELLPPDAVLVGHCLDLDLRVLKVCIYFKILFCSMKTCSIQLRCKDLSSLLLFVFPVYSISIRYNSFILFPPQMIHPYVIDTSLLYAGKQGRRFKLTFLARVILG